MVTGPEYPSMDTNRTEGIQAAAGGYGGYGPPGPLPDPLPDPLLSMGHRVFRVEAGEEAGRAGMDATGCPEHRSFAIEAQRQQPV